MGFEPLNSRYRCSALPAKRRLPQQTMCSQINATLHHFAYIKSSDVFIIHNSVQILLMHVINSQNLKRAHFSELEVRNKTLRCASYFSTLFSVFHQRLMLDIYLKARLINRGNLINNELDMRNCLIYESVIASEGVYHPFSDFP